MCSQGARRGRGPSAYARVAEIMSGRAISQQGLATTCKDPAHNGNTGGVGREMVWRMSPYERGRGGNAPPGGLRGRPGAGNARSGQRGSGHSVATRSRQRSRHRAGLRGACIVAKGRCKLHRVGAKGAPAPQFRAVGEGSPREMGTEPRPEPDSGNPTVRDRRGASGNAASRSMNSARCARLISISTPVR
jgi:hypothetical protein